MGAEIRFADRKLKEEYEHLAGKKDFEWLYKALTRAFREISETPQRGIPLQKYRIPHSWTGEINNLMKYDLPCGWRLLYSVKRSTISIVALVLEWCDHDSYQKKYSGRR